MAALLAVLPRTWKMTARGTLHGASRILPAWPGRRAFTQSQRLRCLLRVRFSLMSSLPYPIMQAV